jgi:transcriptional regulator with XRE-family HTH domain
MEIAIHTFPYVLESRECMAKNLCGAQIKKFRLEHDLTLVDLSAWLKIEAGIIVDRTNLGRIENGSRAVSDYELVAFANLFHVSLDQLLPDDLVKKNGKVDKAG